VEDSALMREMREYDEEKYVCEREKERKEAFLERERDDMK
jgi:hypothetical protein